MKTHLFRIAILGVLTTVTLLLEDCKKDSVIPQKIDATTDPASLSLSTMASTNIVSTVAGTPNSTGFVDGPAKTASFNVPAGIQLAKDGSIYIADRANNAIRKLTSDGIVSTLPLNTPANYSLQSPTSVGVNDAGNIHVLSVIVDQAGQSYIFNKQNTFIAGYEVTYTALGALAKDPYNDFFWFSSGNNIGKLIVGSDGSIGKDYIPYNKGLLTEEEQRRGQTFKGLFVGRNRVVYFSVGPRMFKYTPGGATAQLYPNLPLGNITSIVLNADSRTMYLAADGKIEKIVDGKLTVLAGPNSSASDGRDGAGLKADVHALSLALGDHENSLYFSDSKTNTIRKLMLN
ncbi:hypothetical protein FPZ43_17460 [Mucilaginibacter pallidiroseus]|uniref:NHL repeat-containing protein n=1 Tax=Mucilaginibacter pallidiroseus TaxID=2599295 RepID=A0A563U0V5_9SPHI|nr:hypothetical protein [Mucilaginibacter pallidiroseus]TWR25257.1 hypothetical protein FPZ43_17460 [Mucilaginibacter pallidiroseus]